MDKDDLELRDPASFSHGWSPAASIIHSSLTARAVATSHDDMTMELPERHNDGAHKENRSFRRPESSSHVEHR